jgi:hypothetical protein
MTGMLKIVKGVLSVRGCDNKDVLAKLLNKFSAKVNNRFVSVFRTRFMIELRKGYSSCGFVQACFTFGCFVEEVETPVWLGLKNTTP